MELRKEGLGQALTMGDLESRYKRSVTGLVSFLTDSCCIDTQPPLPPGAGG